MRTPRRISYLGIGLAILYIAFSAACVALALFATSDPKSRYVLLHLPLALQASLLFALGMSSLLVGLPWPAAYFVIGLPSVAFLYLAGWLIAWIFVPQPSARVERGA